MDKLPIPKGKYMVLVRCFTFNHSKYINDALNGFVMQQTSFPFVCLIVDDASTDGEQQIIKFFLEKECDMSAAKQYNTEPAEVIIVPHSSNKQCTFAVYFLRENHYSNKKNKSPYVDPWRNCCRYEALCEGDDYWIEQNKIEMQVAVLENNPNVSLVYSSFKTIDEAGDEVYVPFYRNNIDKSFSGDNFYQLLKGNYIQTLTVCHRIEILHSKVFKDCPHKYDYALFLTSAVLGDLRFLNIETGSYRLTSIGAMATKKNLYLSYKNRVLYFFAIHYLSLVNNRLSIRQKILGRINVARIFLHYKRYNYFFKMFLPF